MIEAVHSERVSALREVQGCMTVEETRDIACALVVAEDGFPALAVSRVDGIGGTLTLGCAYHRSLMAWWIVTRRDGMTVGVAPSGRPFAAADWAIREMRRRTA